MRAYNIKTIIKTGVKAFALVALTLSLTACPDKGNKNTRPANGGSYVDPNCTTNCSSTNLLYTAVGTATMLGSKVILGANYHATNQTRASTNGYYTGQVNVTGSFTVRSNIGLIGCEIPAGNYTLNTVAQGQMDGVGTINSVQMDAIGPVTIRMWLNKATFDEISPSVVCEGRQYYEEMVYGDIYIESVNRRNCNNFQVTLGSPALTGGQCL